MRSDGGEQPGESKESAGGGQARLRLREDAETAPR